MIHSKKQNRTQRRRDAEKTVKAFTGRYGRIREQTRIPPLASLNLSVIKFFSAPLRLCVHKLFTCS
jgi:hypothetical protein